MPESIGRVRWCVKGHRCVVSEEAVQVPTCTVIVGRHICRAELVTPANPPSRPTEAP